MGSSILSQVLEFAFVHANKITAVLVAAAALFLVGGCRDSNNWFLMFNVLFLLMGALPALFGSHRSSGVWGAVGDFCVGVVLVSIFAYPTVLRNNDAIDDGAYTLVVLSDVCVVLAVALNLARLNQDVYVLA